MADPAVQPTSYQSQPVPPELTAEQLVEADAFFAQLEAEADEMKYKYMSARVPTYLQPYFLEKYPLPEPPPTEQETQVRPGPDSQTDV